MESPRAETRIFSAATASNILELDEYVQESAMRTELNLGTTLRAIRTSRRLSLADVADATQISPSFLSLVELGKSDITIGRLTRLADFYKVSFSDLLGGVAATDADV